MLHFTASLLFFLAHQAQSQVPCDLVWINEFHYDNVGSPDTQEGIELAGIAGTSIQGWTLVTYNGANGQVLSTINFLPTQELINEESGLGFTSVAPALQNGPDGIALVDDNNNVCEFISYEGSFTAVDGPAQGMTSERIPVSEDGNTPVSTSIQRVSQSTSGSCGSRDDFIWVAERGISFGRINEYQCQTTCDAWINEIHYENEGDDVLDVGERVEIAGLAGTDLTDWTVVFYNGADSQTYSPSLSLSGVLPDETDGLGFVEFDQEGIQNGAPDGLALVDPSGFICEFLSYEGTITALNGAAEGLTSVDIGVNEDNALPNESLQLQGGCGFGEGTWVGPIENTFGSVNDGQCTQSPTMQPSVAPPPTMGPTEAVTCVDELRDCINECDELYGFEGTNQGLSSSSSSSDRRLLRRGGGRHRQRRRWRACRHQCRREYRRCTGYWWRWGWRRDSGTENDSTMSGDENYDVVIYCAFAFMGLVITILLGCVYKKYCYDGKKAQQDMVEMANEIDKEKVTRIETVEETEKTDI